MRAITILALGLMTLGLAGCGDALPSPVPVSGKVTLGGQPVEGATVTFLSSTGGRSASGKTGADGSFQLTTINTNDGARPGDYAVTIAKIESKLSGAVTDVEKGDYGDDYAAQMGAAASGDMSKVQKNNLPEKYATAAESGLTRSVIKGEENNFLFDL
ncbi:MAG: carboxypeptidase-like regulatory domain-containing protein [Pirellulaceae bacterium]